jgi:O-antigen/teichoic acid export membrane protein
MNYKPDKFSHNVISLLGGQIIIAAIALANSIVMARALGVEGRGYFVMAMLLPVMLFTFSDFGLGHAATKLTASKKWPAATVFFSQTILAIIRVILLIVLGVLIIHFYSSSIFPTVPNEYLYTGLAQVIGVVTLGMVFPIFLGIGKGVEYSFILVASASFSLFVFVTAWLVVGLDVKLALHLQVASTLLVAFYVYVRIFKLVGVDCRFSLEYVKDAFRFGLGVYFSIVSNFSNDRLILLIVNFFGGVVAVGLYTIAQALTERIYLIADAVGTMLMPKIAEDPKVNSHMITPLVFKLTFLTVAFLSIVLMFLSEWLVNFIYTSEFSGSVEIMQILLVSVIFSSGWRIISQDLNARSMTKETAIINVIMAVISLGTATILLPIMGLVGAAWGAVIGSIFSIVFGSWFYMHKNTNTQLVCKSFIVFSNQEIQAIKLVLRSRFLFKKKS